MIRTFYVMNIFEEFESRRLKLKISKIYGIKFNLFTLILSLLSCVRLSICLFFSGVYFHISSSDNYFASLTLFYWAGGGIKKDILEPQLVLTLIV